MTSTINPILVLAGAAASVGCSMFAAQLVHADTGIASAEAFIEAEPRMQGLTPVSVGMVIHTRLNQGVWWCPPTDDID